METDDDSVYKRQKEIFGQDDCPVRAKRTIIDGVKKINLRRSRDIWKNKKLVSFIDANTSEGKREALQKKLDYLKQKNEKEYIRRKE